MSKKDDSALKPQLSLFDAVATGLAAILGVVSVAIIGLPSAHLPIYHHLHLGESQEFYVLLVYFFAYTGYSPIATLSRKFAAQNALSLKLL